MPGNSLNTYDQIQQNGVFGPQDNPYSSGIFPLPAAADASSPDNEGNPQAAAANVPPSNASSVPGPAATSATRKANSDVAQLNAAQSIPSYAATQSGAGLFDSYGQQLGSDLSFQNRGLNATFSQIAAQDAVDSANLATQNNQGLFANALSGNGSASPDIPVSGFASRNGALESDRASNATFIDQLRGSVGGDLAANALTLLTNSGSSLLQTGNALYSLVNDPVFARQAYQGLTNALSNPGAVYNSAVDRTSAFFDESASQQATDFGQAGLNFLTGLGASEGLSLGASGLGSIGRYALENFGAGPVSGGFAGQIGALGDISSLKPTQIAPIYEQQIRSEYSNLAPRDFLFPEADGTVSVRSADATTISNGQTIPVEAKFSQDFSESIYNPNTFAGQFITGSDGLTGSEQILSQAERYNSVFGGAIYHTNNIDLLNFYNPIFVSKGYNFQFVLTPLKK